MKILVALSGGIDSSVVAHMLKSQGHELIGVRFTLWSDPLAPSIAQILPSKCCNTQTAMRARETAAALGIPYHIIDLEKEFKNEVVDPFLDGYRNGLTPNPCIRCNRTIKFGKLLEFMKEMGCEKLATGHYARVATEEASDETTHRLLLEATDSTKDQSYYLYGLTQEQLSAVMFPLGGMQKSEVYTLAKHFNVPFDEEYRESQDLCFFPEKSPGEFLKRYLSDAMNPGQIMRRDGTVVGEHAGLPLYTIGQRRGLRIGGLSIPLEVVEKNVDQNTLIVSEQGAEMTNSVELDQMHWVSWQPPENEEVTFECRVRSLSPRKAGMLTYSGKKGVFLFSGNEPPIAPGQSLVLYRGQEVIGGGVMVKGK
jgi:tRNA-specific 2-thiouridylase